MYHDTLKMECRTSSLRVVTKVGLSMLRQVLGAGLEWVWDLQNKNTKKIL
jgi:hypothetical protein